MYILLLLFKFFFFFLWKTFLSSIILLKLLISLHSAMLERITEKKAIAFVGIKAQNHILGLGICPRMLNGPRMNK